MKKSMGNDFKIIRRIFGQALAVALILPASGFAQSSGDTATYIEDTNKHCRVVSGDYRTGDKAIWWGACGENGFAQEMGVLQIFRNGEKQIVYKGKMVDGKFQGFGDLFNVPVDSYYVGYFQDNLKDGKGRLSLADGTEITGMFKDGNADGVVTMITPSRQKLQGQWTGNCLIVAQVPKNLGLDAQVCRNDAVPNRPKNLSAGLNTRSP